MKLHHLSPCSTFFSSGHFVSKVLTPHALLINSPPSFLQLISFLLHPDHPIITLHKQHSVRTILTSRRPSSFVSLPTKQTYHGALKLSPPTMKNLDALSCIALLNASFSIHSSLRRRGMVKGGRPGLHFMTEWCL